MWSGTEIILTFDILDSPGKMNFFQALEVEQIHLKQVRGAAWRCWLDSRFAAGCRCLAASSCERRGRVRVARAFAVPAGRGLL